MQGNKGICSWSGSTDYVILSFFAESDLSAYTKLNLKKFFLKYFLQLCSMNVISSHAINMIQLHYEILQGCWRWRDFKLTSLMHVWYNGTNGNVAVSQCQLPIYKLQFLFRALKLHCVKLCWTDRVNVTWFNCLESLYTF